MSLPIPGPPAPLPGSTVDVTYWMVGDGLPSTPGSCCDFEWSMTDSQGQVTSQTQNRPDGATTITAEEYADLIDAWRSYAP